VTSKPGGRQKAHIAAFLFALAMPFPLIANSDADISNKQMTLCRTAVLCAGLASAVAVQGCATEKRRSMPTDTGAANGVATMPLYDETAYYNAVKNRWFGLGDYATDKPGR
jgi:hypothetical protein